MSTRRIGVVTVTYNSSAEARPFLRSVRSAAPTTPVDVVVVDNDSADRETLRTIVEQEGARLADAGGNRGYGAAANVGVRLLDADIDYVLISNPDVVLGEGSIDLLVASLDGDAGVGAVGPRILEETGEVYPSAREVPRLRNGVGHALFARVWPANPWTRRYHNAGLRTDRPTDVGWLSGACLLVRREAFTAIGGFDEGFFMYFEDVDLGYRLGSAGWRNRYLPAAEVVHIGGRSTAGVAHAMVAEHHRSAIRFVERLYPEWYKAPIRWTVIAGLRTRQRWSTRTPRLRRPRSTPR